jgi:peptidoglycan/LPS O-acetylase OafA/YrhL
MLSPISRQEANRFLILDGIRGLAAISVMVYHYSSNSDHVLMPMSWVSVDLFFALSGFVLTHSFEQKIRSGMSFWSFMKARIIRLYPLYFLGLTTGLLGVLAQRHLNSTSVEISSIAKAYALNLVSLPYFNHGTWQFMGAESNGMCFPLNGPAWTLSLEVMVNVIFYFWARYFRVETLKWMLPIFFVVLITGAYQAGTIEGGWAERNYTMGIYRVLYQFFLGTLLYHKLQLSKRTPNLLVYPLIALLLFFFCWGTFKFMLLAMFVVSPLIIFCGANYSPGLMIRSISKLLGDISYPLYILHAPIYVLVLLVGSSILSSGAQLGLSSVLSLFVAWQIVALDAGFRQYLTKIQFLPRLPSQ